MVLKKCNIKWENENKDNEENVEPNNEVENFQFFKVYLKYKVI